MSNNQKSAAINKIKAQQQAAAAGKPNSSAATAASTSSAVAAPAAQRKGAASSSAARSRWAIDLTEGSREQRVATSSSSNQETVPFGFGGDNGSKDVSDEKGGAARDEAKQAELLHAAAMAIAQAPGKQLLMTCFMLWMSGNSLQIFSIMMLGMALWTPLTEIFSVQTRFARFNDAPISLILPKITFVAMHLAGLAIGLYKCNTMGLLPTSTADWVDTSIRAPIQIAGGGIL